MPTGGVETTKESINAWFKAGIAALGIGSNLDHERVARGSQLRSDHGEDG